MARSGSLKRKLLTLLLPALILLLCGELWASYRDLQVAANSAYDRSLAGAIKAIDANISTIGGGLDMALPYNLLEFFQLTASGQVFYRVTTEDGLVSLGNMDLPQPKVDLQSGVPHFYDAQYFGAPVRVGAYARLLKKPLYGVEPQRVIIQVAESVQSRTTFARGLLAQSALLDALVVLLFSIVVAGGMVWVLRPLQKLRCEVISRAPDDLTPIDPVQVPLEVRPLVDAINHHVERFGQQARSQRRFLDDASHQLRTPLAVLRTQVDYALREPELARVREALGAMQGGIDRAARMVNQLLALARLNNNFAAGDSMEKIDLGELAEDVARMLLPEARRKNQDFGLFIPERRIWVRAAEPLLREALINLLDNAIRYVPEHGHITLTVATNDGAAQVTVVDNGPGMSNEERAAVGERFRRGKAATPGGAGLGLAIAKAIVEQHGGQLVVGAGPDQIGASVGLLLPVVEARVEGAAKSQATPVPDGAVPW